MAKEYIERDKSLLIYVSEDAYEQLQRVPAADVVPVRHGRWKKVIEDSKYYHMECSKCCGRPLRSRWVDDAELSTFCPWCGARMDAVPEQGKVKVTHWIPLPQPPKEET